jgi:hypothetical protein
MNRSSCRFVTAVEDKNTYISLMGGVQSSLVVRRENLLHHSVILRSVLCDVRISSFIKETIKNRKAPSPPRKRHPSKDSSCPITLLWTQWAKGAILLRMKVCGHEFTDTMIQTIQEKVNQEPIISRRALSRLVCEWLDWKSPNGKWKEMSARVALLLR